MSSPRMASTFDAVLVVNHHAVGPILLPEKKQADFIVEFNTTYGRIGLTIESFADLRSSGFENK